MKSRLFTNASDYSNKTCIYRSMYLYLTKYASFVGIVTCVDKEPIRLAPYSQSLQYISATQMACSHHIEVYRCMQMWRHNAKVYILIQVSCCKEICCEQICILGSLECTTQQCSRWANLSCHKIKKKPLFKNLRLLRSRYCHSVHLVIKSSKDL